MDNSALKLFGIRVENFFLIVLLFPYLSLFPLESNIQPWCGLIAMLITLLYIRTNSTVYYDEVFFLFLIIFLFPYFDYSNGFSLSFFLIKKKLGFIFAFFLFFSIRRVCYGFSFSVLYYAVFVYFIVSFLQFLFPSVVSSLLSFLTNRQGSDGLIRGAQSLTTEPSFAGYAGIFFLLFFKYFNAREVISGYKKNSFVLFCIGVVLLSKSGTGYIVGLIFLLVFLSKKNPWYFIFSVFLSFLIVFIMLFMSEYFDFRAFQIVKSFYLYPLDALFRDPSIAIRLLQPFIGFVSLLDYPFGHGSGSFSYVQAFYFNQLSLGDYFNGYAYKRIIFELNTPISVLAQYLIEYGVFMIVFCFWVIWRCYKGFGGVEYAMFVAIALLQAHPIVYPFMWILISISDLRLRNGYLSRG